MFIRQFGHQGVNQGQFTSPYDLVVDTAGNVYVADDPAESVSKFSPTGHFIWRIGGFSSNDPDLVGSEHFATLDTHGRVVMTPVYNSDRPGRVLYIDGDGHKVDSFDPQSGPCDVTVDGVGDTFVTDGCGGPGVTEVFDSSHHLIANCPLVCPLFAAPLFGPHGEAFALGKDGTILKLKITLP
jgi:DNA-binding beta-propeller fold protein YncE